MTSPFGARLHAAVAERGPLCAGIDPHASLLQAWGLDDDVAGLERFALTAVEGLAPHVSVVKPQSAFYERFGSRGVAVLERVIAESRAAGALVLLDVKRGDIGSTSQAYADAYLDPASPAGLRRDHAQPVPRLRVAEPFVDTARRFGAGRLRAGDDLQHGGAGGAARRHRGGETVASGCSTHLRQLNEGEEPLGSFGAVIGATVSARWRRPLHRRTGAGPRVRRAGWHRRRSAPDLRRLGRCRAAQLLARTAEPLPAPARLWPTQRAGRTTSSRGCADDRPPTAAGVLADRAGSGAGAPLGACSTPKENYCSAVEKHQLELTEITSGGGQDALIRALDILRDLRSKAPSDISDEWQQVVERIQALVEALDDGRRGPRDVRPGQHRPAA